MLNRKLGDFSWKSPWIVLYLKRPRKLASLFKRLRNVLSWSVLRFRFLFHYQSQTIRSSTVTASFSSVCYNDPRKCKCNFISYSGIPIFWTSKRNENCMVQNIGEFEKSGVKRLRRGNDFWLKLSREVRKNEGSRNRDPTVYNNNNKFYFNPS